ncbi:hypothetical protein [Microbacterium elymi]|jgi:hypothetical protein|uniref:Uncharacterized protein n=1 Tax=Microbacterium elymi TaxID=2909587 RepID=A0ABY5NKI0_9MICO|nr:hypothetical protein [Microbacterium elymi]UUT35665.1 hypothetical protein L2X98_20605 [Microbacterium elymi]
MLATTIMSRIIALPSGIHSTRPRGAARTEDAAFRRFARIKYSRMDDLRDGMLPARPSMDGVHDPF